MGTEENGKGDRRKEKSRENEKKDGKGGAEVS